MKAKAKDIVQPCSIESLELMVDRYGLGAVLGAIANICGRKYDAWPENAYFWSEAESAVRCVRHSSAVRNLED